MTGHDYILIDTNYDWATPVIMLNASQTRYLYSKNKTIYVDKYSIPSSCNIQIDHI